MSSPQRPHRAALTHSSSPAESSGETEVLACARADCGSLDDTLWMADEMLALNPLDALNLCGQVDPAQEGEHQRLWRHLIAAEAHLKLGHGEETDAELRAAEGTVARWPQWQARYFMLRGQRSLSRGDFDGGRTDLERAVRRAVAQGQPAEEANALSVLAQFQHSRGESLPALATLDRVERLRTEIDDVAGVIRTACNKAVIMIALGNAGEALSLLTDAQEKLPHSATPQVSDLYVQGNLGLLLEQMNRLDEAGAHFSRARDLARTLGDTQAEVIMTLNGGETARKLGLLEDAQTLLEAALTLATSLGLERAVGSAQHSLGLLYSRMGRMDDAERLLSESERSARTSGDLDAQIESLLGRGRNWANIGEARKAIPALTKALKLADDNHRLQAAFDAHALLADVYERSSPRLSNFHLRAGQQLERDLRDVAMARQARDLAVEAELESMRWTADHQRQLREVSERARLHAEEKVQEYVDELKRGRLYDDLTGLPNRLLMGGLLGQTLPSVMAESRSVALGILDLNRFKLVNDALGHAGGDALLRQVAERLSAVMRVGDTLCRIGSDEFVVILAPCGPNDLPELSARLMGVFTEEFHVENEDLVAGASLGVAFFPQHGEDADALLKSAHAALADAKAISGVAVFTDATPATPSLSMESALARALERREFEIHFQPLVDSGTGQAVAAEALLRWNSPVHGRRSPAEFIPMLERSGQIVPVGEWVLREACAQAAAWPGDVRVAVNLSARQFMQGDLADCVRRALSDSGLCGSRLELEITESLMMQSPERAARLLDELKSTGCRVMLDDFGTGYSNLSYLQTFPLDGLKIDRSFVLNLNGENRERGGGMIHAIMEIGRVLNLDVVAEGIETDEQWGQLRTLGVPTLQGYLFGRPQAGWTPTPSP